MSESIKTGVLIVGASHAGVECAVALRAAGYAEPIALLGAEAHVPYHRPPLSKDYLAGKTTPERLMLRSPDVFQKQDIQWFGGQTATELDISGKSVKTAAGLSLQFDHCVLATGASARHLPGLQGPNVHAIRTLDDANALRGALAAGVRLLVLGGGYLGLEVASTATKLGAQVCVVESSPVLMSGRVSAYTAQRFETLHRQSGIEVYLGVQAQSWRNEGGCWHVELDNRAGLQADVLLVAIGATPNVDLAQRAGVLCSAGIQVDAACRTSAEHIYAIGDCTLAWREPLQRSARVESVQNALEQARTAAAAIAGKPLPPVKPSTFWSEQQGHRLQMAGLVDPQLPIHDTPTETASGWLVERRHNDVLVGVEAVNSPADFVRAMRRISEPA